ncbi:alpha/beta-hydrolase [Gyrodon lividus]|nr:alpha/beta-hydrolase [Gyrodon lividus]
MANLEDKELGPEYQTMFDPRTCARRGLCPVSQIRRHGVPFESHSLYFEVHGTGPQKILFIMGLSGPSFAWLPQVEHFGKLDQYSVLVFDNRGVGMSGSPKGPYTTTCMAEDAICLLDYLGWTAERDLHIVGISLGGMIAQELAYRIPERTKSLSLVVTRAGGHPWNNLPSLEGFMQLTRPLTVTDREQKIPMMTNMLFPTEWLDAKAEDDPEGRTNREIQVEAYRRRFEITRPQTLMGSLGQMSAGVTHRVTPDRLRKISASIPKVLILSAAEDNIIHHSQGEFLKSHMTEAEYQCWEKAGHGISAQYKVRFNQLLERVFEEGQAAIGKHTDIN